MTPRTSRIARALAWLLLAAITFATLAPIDLRPISGASVSLERFLAFAALGAAFACAFPERRLFVAFALLTLVGLLEAGQLVTLTRHAHLADFIMKGVGAMMGLTLIAWVSRPRSSTAEVQTHPLGRTSRTACWIRMRIGPGRRADRPG